MATLANLRVNLGLNSAAYAKGLGRASSGTNAFRKTAIRLGATLAGVFGARQLLRSIKSIATAFTVQEDAVQGLRASLIATGKSGTASLEALTHSAAELQKVTRAGDEAIIAATASMALLAPALDTAGLQDAQKAIIGIAETFTKGDLESAALLIGKSVGSTTNALTRYGIQVDVTATQQEKMAQILEQSNNFFEVAKARADTTAGAMIQMKNAFGDVKEAIGQILATRSGFKNFLQRVTTTLADIATILSGSTPQIERMFGLLGIIAANAYSQMLLSGLANMMDKAIRAMSNMPMILVADFIVLADQMQEIFARVALQAGASIEGAVIELGEIADKIRALGPDVEASVREGVTVPIIKQLSTLREAGVSAARSLIRGFISGTESLKDLLVSVMTRLGEDLIIGSLEKALKIGSPSKAAAVIGRQTVAGFIGGLQGASGRVPAAVGSAFALAPAGAGGGAVVVNQTINFNPGFVDGASGAAWLRANKGAIAMAMREAAQDAGGIRRLLG